MAPQDEKKESRPAAGPAAGRDTLGEFLREIRIGNRIDLHKMAADTRLNADYITAIERNEFAKIPGETYRKIFIKNIARYLGLDPEKVFQRYLRETAAPLPAEKPAPPAPPADGPDKTTGAKKETYGAVRPPIKNIVIFLIIIFAVFMLLLLSQQRQGRQAALPSEPDSLAEETAPAVDSALLPKVKPGPPVPVEKPAAPVPVEKPAPPVPVEKPAPPAPVEKPAPPVPVEKPVPPAPVEKPAAPAPAAKPAAPAPGSAGTQAAAPAGSAFTDESKGALKVRVTADTDSVRVMAFRNNQLWANTFRKGNTKIFASDTALYFNLSGPDLKVTLHLNNVLLRFSPKIARIIRVAPGGVTYITAEAWQKLAAPRDSVNAR